MDVETRSRLCDNQGKGIGDNRTAGKQTEEFAGTRRMKNEKRRTKRKNKRERMDNRSIKSEKILRYRNI